MTINERLISAGLLNQWDRAVFARDLAQMIAVLQQVELTAAEAASVAASVLEDPTKYGF